MKVWGAELEAEGPVQVTDSLQKGYESKSVWSTLNLYFFFFFSAEIKIIYLEIKCLGLNNTFLY